MPKVKDNSKTKIAAASQYISNPLLLFAPSWNAISKNLGGIIGVFAVALAIPFVIAIFGTVLFLITLKGGFSVISIIILSLVSLLLAIFLIAFAPAITIALLESAKGSRIQVKPVLRESFQFAPAIFGAGILTILAVIGGLFLFVIPGLIFGAWFSLATYVIVDQKVGAIEGMKRSKALVKQHVFEMWGLYSVSGVINILNIIPFIGALATVAFSIAFAAAPALRYLQLKELKAAAPNGEHSTHWLNYALILLSLASGGIVASADTHKTQSPGGGLYDYQQQMPGDGMGNPSSNSDY